MSEKKRNSRRFYIQNKHPFKGLICSFELWYRSLNNAQAAYFVANILLILIVTAINNPLLGYESFHTNPWWWIYGQESKAYYAWLDDSNYRTPKPIYRFETLGGLVNCIIFLLISSKSVIWFLSIRRKHTT